MFVSTESHLPPPVFLCRAALSSVSGVEWTSSSTIKNQIGYLFSVALAEQGAPPPTISPYRAISAGRGRLTHTHNVNLAPVVLVRLYCFSGSPTCWPVASGSCTVKQTDPYLLLQGWKTRTWVSSDSRCGGGRFGNSILLDSICDRAPADSHNNRYVVCSQADNNMLARLATDSYFCY